MKNFKNNIYIPLFVLSVLLTGCDSFFYDDLDNCPQGVYVSFFSKTPCAEDSTFIGEVPSLSVFAFDENEKLVTSITKEKVTLSSDYEVLFPVSDGYFTFIAWAGIDNKFILSSFTPGITTKEDVILTIRSSESKAENLAGTRLWQGKSPVVFLPDPKEFGEVYKHTSINLQEQTNRVKIIVEIDDSVTEFTPEDLSIAVSSANGTINIDGSMPYNSPQLLYPVQNTVYTDNSVTWDYTLLKLLTGYNNKLKIEYTKTGEKVFDGDLIASILLNTVSGGVNLECQNDFTVKFVIKDYCAECGTHFSCAIYVNGWLVHSYSTEL